MKNNTLLPEIIELLKENGTIRTKISETCCMPERTPNLNKAQSLLDDIITDVQNEKIHDSFEKIGRFGKQLGFLYATCCTLIKEPMYQHIFRNMMSVHVKLWETLGHSH